ncbi:MAG: endonuclease/exonuclease/phosphatase family protein [Candidatus Tectomicrobia bacterium]|uniref:Endonuclease/exonuclease/phosphatase family protein n=1 Tax=Tectimicrobiota bacterium TaxID=2528274 RepID=A0A932HYM9_UNCTE|nr:endonuclease/exonuclease/phosphatase family protein [Candidatus Tectomicrobia bacterium]
MRREHGCFSISSYNIHRCIGSDGGMDPGRISQVIGEMDCDIVGLQEVDSHRTDGGLSYQMDYLSDATGLVAIPGPTIQTQDRHYGNVLLSAHPVLDVRRLDLSVRGRENRGALDVDVEIHGRRVRVVVTHFGLFGTERRQQTARLLEYLGTACCGMCVLLGDINNWLPFGPMSHRLNFHFGRTPLQRTYPAWLPILGLDRIWVSPPRALLDISVHRSRLARMASDHLPLKAVIRAL